MPHQNDEDASLPAYTPEDARVWVLANYSKLNEHTNMIYSTLPTITSVEFMPALQASRLMDSTIDLASDAPVCVVTIDSVVQRQPVTKLPVLGYRGISFTFDGRTGSYLTYSVSQTEVIDRSIIVGAQAIKPKETIPAFTAEEVSRWVMEHPVTVHHYLTDRSVGSVEFLTNAEAERIIHKSIDLADDATVCLVKVDGIYNFHSPMSTVQTPTYNFTYMVFDATTGNLLIAGGDDGSNDPRT